MAKPGFELKCSSLSEKAMAPFQYSCLENPMDRGAWEAAVHGVTKSRTWLSDFTFTFHFHALEKEMATHSSVLAWRIPGTGEPGGLPSIASHRVRHDWNDLAAAHHSGPSSCVCQTLYTFNPSLLWSSKIELSHHHDKCMAPSFRKKNVLVFKVKIMVLKIRFWCKQPKN